MLHTECFTARGTGKKKICLSALARAVKWAQLKPLQQAVRATSMHFTAASPIGTLESVSHSRHSPIGTVNLATKEQKKKKKKRVVKRAGSYARSRKQINDVWFCVDDISPLSSISGDCQYFWLCPFLPENSIRADLWFVRIPILRLTLKKDTPQDIWCSFCSVSQQYLTLISYGTPGNPCLLRRDWIWGSAMQNILSLSLPPRSVGRGKE